MTGPGRPPVGPKIEVRLPSDLIAFLGYAAKKIEMTRPDYIRDLLSYSAMGDGYYEGWVSPDPGFDRP